MPMRMVESNKEKDEGDDDSKGTYIPLQAYILSYLVLLVLIGECSNVYYTFDEFDEHFVEIGALTITKQADINTIRGRLI